MHYYKKNIGDYHKKAGRLSMLEHGAYTLLMDACYDREKFPTLEEAIEWTWARTEAEVEAVKFVLTRFFELRDGRYVQARIEEEVSKFHEISETNSRIAKEREEKRKERARSVLEPCEKEHEAPPNQEPLTINQEKTYTGNPVESAVADPCPHQAIVDLYHKSLPELAGVRDITEKRKTALRARWRSHKRFQTLDFWRQYFELVSESDFLMGRMPGKSWQADFDFLIKSDKFQKIIEGGYQNG